MIAGAQLCEIDAVKHTVEGGRPSVDFLLNHGVQFTLDEDEQLHLTREGGHSQRRIIHSADATGHKQQSNRAVGLYALDENNEKILPQAMVLPWHIAQAVVSQIWNLINSIQPVYIILKHAHF
ncbi:unnamed protein product [Oppiella nova]|uniref:FAD-dependent oxidoreductase 2 FAD-binding domain-containing protein n=1 Tax=Oppiella nova TaxID=334625 RepID=A0A7R9L7E9_9ACAR|nr:unnamed protein product [Oppiella nova]CAG2156893.1 unnamed protein product [Oppiella nova]